MQNQRYDFRFSLFFLLLVGALIFFAFKLVFIQFLNSSEFTDIANKQHNRSIEIEPTRGTIYDCNMRPLAFNVTAYSLYANSKVMTLADKRKNARELSGIIGMTPEQIEAKLKKDRYFVWIKRKMPPEIEKLVQTKKLKGIGFQKESRRYYPDGSLAAHIIGFANIDNQGLEGIELQLDQYLKGKSGWMALLRDARQHDLMINDDYVRPVDGNSIVLTIDETIQFIAENALEENYKKYNAKAGMIIVMDVKTGEILALANRPTYNLSDFNNSDLASRTNRVISYVFEPGSVFKIVAASAAIETGAFNETDKIFCENGKYKVANHVLHDSHPLGTLTFSEVIEESSNIGTTKIAQKLGPQIFYNYAHAFRFGMKTGIDLKGEVDGWLKAPSQWSKTSIGAIPIGQEVTVTPLQLLCALSAIANKGVYMKPFVVKKIQDPRGNVLFENKPEMLGNAIEESTAARVTKILENVVNQGTGTKAQIKGVAVAGKTGTSQKVVGGTYSHNSYYGSFMGFAPADNPRIACIVVYDEPHPFYYGGTVSAPVFSEVVEKSLKYLQMSGRD